MSSRRSRAGAGPLQGEGACDQGELMGAGLPAPAGVWVWQGEGLGSDVEGWQEARRGFSGRGFQSREAVAPCESSSC